MLTHAQPPPLDPLTRAQAEQTYAQALSLVVLLARLLGKPCPIKVRDERRGDAE